MTGVILALSSISVLFAMVSVVSGVVLAVLIVHDTRQASNSNGMASFNRHLNALSDDSRAHLRQQLLDAQQRQRRK